MLIIRLVHLKDMPSYESVLESLKENNFTKYEDNKKETVSLSNDKRIFSNNEESEIVKTSKEQIKNIIQTKPILSDLDTKKILKDSLEKISSMEELISISLKKQSSFEA